MISKEDMSPEIRAALKNKLKQTFNEYGLELPSKAQRTKSWQSEATTFENDGFTFKVSDLGDKTQEPCLVLAGGPGSPHSSDYKVVLAPRNERRAIMFDPRGVGLSQHFNVVAAANDNDKHFAYVESLKTNTLDKQIEDIEIARSTVCPESKIYIRGNSWGTTVALAYAQAYPQNVSALILTSPYLSAWSEEDMILSKEGECAKKYPAQFETFLNAIGETYETVPVRADHVAAKYFEAFQNKDPESRKNAFKAWLQWEQVRDGANAEISDEVAMNENKQRRAMTMTFYYSNHSFLPENGVLTKPEVLKGIDTYVIGNSTDPVVAPFTLTELADKIPHAQFVDIPRPRHSRTCDEDFNMLHIQEMAAVKMIVDKQMKRKCTI